MLRVFCLEPRVSIDPAVAPRSSPQTCRASWPIRARFSSAARTHPLQELERGVYNRCLIPHHSTLSISSTCSTCFQVLHFARRCLHDTLVRAFLFVYQTTMTIHFFSGDYTPGLMRARARKTEQCRALQALRATSWRSRVKRQRKVRRQTIGKPCFQGDILANIALVYGFWLHGWRPMAVRVCFLKMQHCARVSSSRYAPAQVQRTATNRQDYENKPVCIALGPLNLQTGRALSRNLVLCQSRSGHDISQRTTLQRVRPLEIHHHHNCRFFKCCVERFEPSVCTGAACPTRGARTCAPEGAMDGPCTGFEPTAARSEPSREHAGPCRFDIAARHVCMPQLRTRASLSALRRSHGYGHPKALLQMR